MKLTVLFSLMAIAAFAQDGKYSIGGGLDNGMFAVGTVKLSENTSTYTNVHFSGYGASLSQGLSYNFLRIDAFHMAAAVDAGLTTGARLITNVGVVPSYDLSKWSRISGLAVFGRIQMQSVGYGFSPNLAVGLSKSF